jgi:hypothetical protein
METAKLCTEVQRGNREQLSTLAKSLMRVLGAPESDWQASYNAACFFSRSLKLTQGSSEREQYKLRAFEHLRLALNDPRSRLTPTWICQDPDLKPLLEDPRAVLIAKHCKETRRASQDLVEKARLRIALGVVAAAAARREKEWTARRAQIADWNGMQWASATRWCREEEKIWQALDEWSGSPLSDSLQQDFWSAQMVAGDPAVAPKIDVTDRERDSLRSASMTSAWTSLGTVAKRKATKWDNRDNRVRERRDVVTQQRFGAWAEAAERGWRSLLVWMREPLNRVSREAFETSDD